MSVGNEDASPSAKSATPKMPMSLSKKLGISLLLIGAAAGVLELFLGSVAPDYFAGRWEDAILVMGLFIIGSILFLAAVVVFHFIWRDHQP